CATELEPHACGDGHGAERGVIHGQRCGCGAEIAFVLNARGDRECCLAQYDSRVAAAIVAELDENAHQTVIVDTCWRQNLAGVDAKIVAEGKALWRAHGQVGHSIKYAAADAAPVSLASGLSPLPPSDGALVDVVGQRLGAILACCLACAGRPPVDAYEDKRAADVGGFLGAGS